MIQKLNWYVVDPIASKVCRQVRWTSVSHDSRTPWTKNKIYQWKHLNTWLGRSIPDHKEPIRSQITVTETSRSLHGCHVSHMHMWNHVTLLPINSPMLRAKLNISCVECNTPHFLCWPQSTCSPRAIHVLLININYFN